MDNSNISLNRESEGGEDRANLGDKDCELIMTPSQIFIVLPSQCEPGGGSNTEGGQ